MNQCYRKPDARAIINGGKKYPRIHGEAVFFQTNCAVKIIVKIKGLPENETGFYGFHIHEGERCSGESFSDTGGHYNPNDEKHPCHAGDLPPLLSCSGNSYMEVKTDRFRVKDVIGKTVIIHAGTDDLRTQPSGNSGDKIACGEICRE